MDDATTLSPTKPFRKKGNKLQQKGYPRDWARISKRIRFKRAKGVCERCGKRHGEIVHQGPQGAFQRDGGQWFDEHGQAIDRPPPWPTRQWWDHLRHLCEPPKLKRVKVVLHTAHLDHNPSNCADENLAALCQACHLRYDVDLHKFTWGVTRDLARGQRVFAFAAEGRVSE